MSMIQARAPLQYGIISTTTMRKKNQSTNKKTSCYYYESFSLSFPVPFVASDFLDHRVSPRPIASPFINNFKVVEFHDLPTQSNKICSLCEMMLIIRKSFVNLTSPNVNNY